ncbi:diacylglycerol/lipid kinase family protein [Streptomyces violascens]|uniref:diacylglycerol/lipid kinase family protein n=1 Tax=Streptomyces violascens TaxID=67381 RepID=UPI0036820E75
MTPSLTSVLVVANPAAGTYTPEMSEAVVRRIAGVGAAVELAVTERPGHAHKLASAVGERGGPALLVSIGGDGTAHDLMTGLYEGAPAERRVPLLVLPFGTGNSFYREIWSDRPWQEALESALSRPRVRRVDLARVAETDGLALLGASSGLAAQTLVTARSVADTGRARYEEALARTVEAFRPYPGRVTVDGEVVHAGPTVSVGVGGGRHRGGRFMLLPRSVMDDALLDVCVAGTALPLPELLRLCRDGSHVGGPGVVYARGRRVVVERTDGEPLVFEYDGDLLPGAAARYTLDVDPHALPVLAP